METMEALRIEFQPTPRKIVVLIMDHREEIRSTLATHLEDEGYIVIEAEDFAEACAFIDAATTPKVAVIGSVGMGDQNDVECLYLCYEQSQAPATTRADPLVQNEHITAWTSRYGTLGQRIGSPHRTWLPERGIPQWLSQP